MADTCKRTQTHNTTGHAHTHTHTMLQRHRTHTHTHTHTCTHTRRHKTRAHTHTHTHTHTHAHTQNPESEKHPVVIETSGPQFNSSKVYEQHPNAAWNCLPVTSDETQVAFNLQDLPYQNTRWAAPTNPQGSHRTWKTWKNRARPGKPRKTGGLGAKTWKNITKPGKKFDLTLKRPKSLNRKSI